MEKWKTAETFLNEKKRKKKYHETSRSNCNLSQMRFPFGNKINIEYVENCGAEIHTIFTSTLPTTK